jgi:hypothetical protein
LLVAAAILSIAAAAQPESPGAPGADLDPDAAAADPGDAA